MRAILIISALLLLSGCFETRIDGKNDSSFKASIQKMKESLPKDKQERFTEDVLLLTMKNFSLSDLMSGKAKAEDALVYARADLNGKTADEITAQAAAVRAEREQREREQALAEIAELQQRKADAEKAKQELAKFEIKRSRFFIEDGEYSFQRKPIIDLEVVNGTGQPISRAYFQGTIATPGRAVPWFSGSFNYQIPGGLEAGEAAKWRLAPNQFSDWGKVDAPADAVFTVEVMRLDGADQKALFDSRGLDESQLARLEALKTKYAIQ